MSWRVQVCAAPDFPHFFASFHVRIYFISCSVKTHFLTSLPSPSPEGFSAVLSASCGSVTSFNSSRHPIEAYEMWRTEIRRSCEWNAVQNLRDKSCAGSPAQRLKSRLSRGARDVLAPKRYEAQESTHLLLVVVDELFIVLSSVSHGCLWNRKGKGGDTLGKAVEK